MGEVQEDSALTRHRRSEVGLHRYRPVGQYANTKPSGKGGHQDNLNIGGLSDAIVNVVSKLLESDSARFVRDVEAIKLWRDRLHVESPVTAATVAGVFSFAVQFES
ncbi:MAG TPA: hypothetical protein DDW52_20290 [Planctomycetaceae bacterium]|nr:hypothetical protein [Planctomycetaceae bacterium]